MTGSSSATVTGIGAYPRARLRTRGAPAAMRTMLSSACRSIGRSCTRKRSAIPGKRESASSSSVQMGSSLRFPLVATSGNLSEEPICTDELEALSRLPGMADLFLVHDRPIERHADDSIVRIAAGAPRVLRRARGYAPMPVTVAEELPVTVSYTHLTLPTKRIV